MHEQLASQIYTQLGSINTARAEVKLERACMRVCVGQLREGYNIRILICVGREGEREGG